MACGEHQPFERRAFQEYTTIVHRSNAKKKKQQAAAKSDHIPCPVCGKEITSLVVCKKTVDLLLQTTDTNVNSVSIGTNGKIHHAEPSHNRVGEEEPYLIEDSTSDSPVGRKRTGLGLGLGLG